MKQPVSLVGSLDARLPRQCTLQPQTFAFNLTVPHFRRVPTADGLGTTSEPLPATQERVEITLDWKSLLLALGVKAVHSQGGKSCEANGAVTVRHVRPKRKQDKDSPS